ncbi:MBL fold metallo-hydrolase [candidate division KSB1 bacterium]|nr:MBL fold metallo-hydrolase [candidate division KSB1 bacterium]
MKPTIKIQLLMLVLFFMFAGVANFVFAQTTVQDIKLADNLIITPAGPGVYRIVHSLPWPANSLLVQVANDQFVMVDTPWDNYATQLVVEWLQREFPSAKLLVINTHFHRDCLGGNGYLVEHKIPTYGADMTVDLLDRIGHDRDENSMREFRDQGKRELADVYKASPLVAPTTTFPINQGMLLPFSGDTLEVFYPGPGHTVDNITVYFRNRKLLFGGCLLKSLGNRNIGFIGDADVLNWSASIDRLREQFPLAETVIPGHGAWGNMALLSHTQEIIAAYLQQNEKPE